MTRNGHSNQDTLRKRGLSCPMQVSRPGRGWVSLPLRQSVRIAICFGERRYALATVHAENTAAVSSRCAALFPIDSYCTFFDCNLTL
jgi:hypothetical protein